MMHNFHFLILIFFASFKLNEANESQPDAELNTSALLDSEVQQQKELVVDEQTGPLLIDGETAWDGLQVEGWTK
jgi:hypothetical protein